MVNDNVHSFNSVQNVGAKPKVPRKPKKMNSTQSSVNSLDRPVSFYNETLHCNRSHRPISLEENSMSIWSRNTDDPDIPIETTIISTASLVLSQFPDHTSSQYPHSKAADTPLSDYDNSSSPTPPLGLLSKSSSTSSACSFNMQPYTKSAHSLSSTSLSSVTFPMFQPIEFPPNTYLFHTSDCEDHGDYVSSSFARSLHGIQTTPSPLLSRPSSPLPPTPSPNFSRSPSPCRSSRRLNRAFSPVLINSVLETPLYSRSLNTSRDNSPLRLRPSSYTRPLSPNPPTMSPGPPRGQSPRNMTLQSAPKLVCSQPSSPQSQHRSFYHQSVNPCGSCLNKQRSQTSPLSSTRNLSLRSPPSPTRAISPASGHLLYSSRSPVTSRPPSPMNTSRQHSLLLPCVRPARSRSQPPGSHRLHSRAR